MKLRRTIALIASGLSLVGGSAALQRYLPTHEQQQSTANDRAVLEQDRVEPSAQGSANASSQPAPAVQAQRASSPQASPDAGQVDTLMEQVNTGTAPVTDDSLGKPTEPTLKDFIANGDPRSPPVLPADIDEDIPTETELADPVAYRRFEDRQHTRHLFEFAIDGRRALTAMRHDIDRAAAARVTVEQLNEAEDKARHLAAVLERIDPVTGELRP